MQKGKLRFLIVVLCYFFISSSNSFAQQVLFNNGLNAGGSGTGGFVTNATAGFGGAPISELATSLGLSTIGFGAQIASNNSVADDFTIPVGETWEVSSLEFFTYQTGSTTTSTINNLQLRIWNGAPDAGGTVVYGDLSTNMLSSTSFSGVYRVTSTTLTNNQRPIMSVRANLPSPVTFTAGTYWIEYRFGGSLTSGPWACPIAITGQTITGNGKQNINGTWNNLIDGGTGNPAQGLPFIISGTKAGEIEVRGIDNSVIANGTTTTTVTNGTNFGSISVASTPYLDKTFTIANVATANLIVSNITSSNPNFVIQAQATSPITGGNTTTFTVRFAPITFGSFTSTISITNNDTDENPYTFRVSGTATAPQIAVSGLGNNIPNNKFLTLSIDGTFLGVATTGNAPKSTFTIQNTGNESLTINNITTPQGSSFSIENLPSVIGAGSSADFTVLFNSNNGSKLDTLTINSNGANAPMFKFAISAGGIVSALEDGLFSGNIEVYPNPSIGSFQVKISDSKYTSINASVYDLNGKFIQNYSINQFNGFIDINLDKYAKGSYLLILEAGGEKAIRKLIKQ